MSNLEKILWLGVIVFVFSIAVYPQSTVSPLEQRRQAELNRQRREQDLRERKRNLDKLNQDHIRSKQEALRNARNPKFPPLTAEQEAANKEILTPNSEDLSKYKAFLQKPDTGIFRLFPDFDCVEKSIIRVDGDCANLVPDSWFYSFRQRKYSDEDVFDIRLKDGNIISDGLLTQGVLVTLGDVPLENIELQSDGVNYLTAFQPKKNREAARIQYEKIKDGIKSGNFTYSNEIKAVENTTYALRVVAYRYEDKLNVNTRVFGGLTENDKKFLHLGFDKRKDLLVAFRIIRKSEDRGVTILWKQLEERKSPKFVYQKDEELDDFK